jgi:hypothetical protein
MNGPAKAILLTLTVLVVGGAAFWGGVTYRSAQTPAGANRGGLGVAADAVQGAGGPMANLSDEERAKLENMSEEERLEYLQENFGSAAGSAGGPMRGGTLEGEIIEVAADTITLSLENGGSQTVYTDKDTLIAYTEGAGALAAGADVVVIAEPTADGVTDASLVVVK